MTLSDAWNDGQTLAGDAVRFGKNVVMAPAEIAPWALREMFGGDEDLHKIAQARA